MTNPQLKGRHYDLLACIDGLEHIEERFQSRLIEEFYKALKWSGVLVITTPEKTGETVNQYHKHELTLAEFNQLISKYLQDMQILKIKDWLHNGTQTNLLFGICRKED